MCSLYMPSSAVLRESEAALLVAGAAHHEPNTTSYIAMKQLALGFTLVESY